MTDAELIVKALSRKPAILADIERVAKAALTDETGIANLQLWAELDAATVLAMVEVCHAALCVVDTDRNNVIARVYLESAVKALRGEP